MFTQRSFAAWRLPIAAQCLFALGIACLVPVVSRADSRPNILFCISDDQSWLHAGAMGDPVVKTPTFDRIAREGILFTHAFCDAPSCAPSRSAILTGQHISVISVTASSGTRNRPATRAPWERTRLGTTILITAREETTTGPWTKGRSSQGPATRNHENTEAAPDST